MKVSDGYAWRVLVIWLATMVAGGCGPTSTSIPSADADTEEAVVVVTQWTDTTELFLEYAPLVATQTSRFAIHLTNLDTFAPISDGRVVVSLDGDVSLSSSTDAPSVPGIFGVDVTPTVPGSYQLRIRLEGDSVRDLHAVGTVSVHADASDLVEPPREDPGGIGFLKEQQWVLDFATAPAEPREMAESLVIAAEIEPRTGGHADVTTPVAGRLVGELLARPIGSQVAPGDILAEITPHSAHVEDRPVLELGVAEAPRCPGTGSSGTRPRRAPGGGRSSADASSAGGADGGANGRGLAPRRRTLTCRTSRRPGPARATGDATSAS